ncbi:MAG: hypothetical protein RLZZ401_340 [Pseudomonadota bacterium]
MQLIITDTRFARSRAIHLSGSQLMVVAAFTGLALLGSALGISRMLPLDPVLGSPAEVLQRDRYLRENLDSLAQKVGAMQAKLMQLETLGERVSGLAGLNPNDIKVTPGRGGALVSGRSLSMEELQATLNDLESLTGQRTDVMTLVESRLFEQKMKTLMVPTQQPVAGGSLGSNFGWRIDPITGRSALHTGLDFQADSGTAIYAAAGGIVVTQEYHPAYGNMVEIDHGNDLLTRYAHASRVLIKKGDLIRRGQKIAEVGTTGRSTGPHLHFEVLVQGVFQDPQKFLSAGNKQPKALVAQLPAPGH